MTPPSVTLNEGETLEEAWKKIKGHRFTYVPILSDEGKVLGVLSESDLMHAVLSEGKRQLREVIKEKRVICATADTDMDDIAGVFFEEKVSVMPVVDEKARLIGLLTTTDVMETIYKVSDITPWKA